VEVIDLPVLEADPIQMRQLLQNLIANGLRFQRPGIAPRVWVRGRMLPAEHDQACDLVQIEVEDNGIGFDMKYLERIFKPFERLHGRSEYEGTGMGLAICKKIVERHQGTITAQSSAGAGACFIVTLPLKQND
jgi:signal transduction histidine kinase